MSGGRGEEVKRNARCRRQGDRREGDGHESTNESEGVEGRTAFNGRDLFVLLDEEE